MGAIIPNIIFFILELSYNGNVVILYIYIYILIMTDLNIDYMLTTILKTK
jgi:hypothetical protein